MSFLSSLRFWQQTPEPTSRCLIVGADGSGKTLLLYRWYQGEAVTTIPTIGFNVQTIKRDGEEVNFWDIGGCSNVAHLVWHYVAEDVGMLFLHKLGKDESWTKFSIEILHIHVKQLLSAPARVFRIAFTNKPADEEKAQAAIEEAGELFRREFSQYGADLDWKILGACDLRNPQDEPVIWDIYRDVAVTLREDRQLRKPIREAAKRLEELKLLPPPTSELVKRIKEEDDSNVSPETFWKKLNSGKLEKWDHRTHLRAGYIILVNTLYKLESVPEAGNEFQELLERLREQNPQLFRNTSHRTMTLFWLYQLRAAIIHYRGFVGFANMPLLTDFQEVLLSSPQLMHSGLWRDYYSKDVMFSPGARDYWRLPDLKPIPGLEPPEAPPKINSKYDYSKEDERLMRFGFSVVKKYLGSNQRRGAVVTEALNNLRATTMTLRTKHRNVAPYSETQAYFWIQIMHAACATLTTGDRSSKEVQFSFSALDFPTCILLFNLTPLAWQQYYTPTRWQGMEGRMGFLPPDLKPLPNVIKIPSTRSINGAITKRLQASMPNQIGSSIDVPSPGILLLQAKELIADARNIPNPVSDEITSHAQLLLNLHTRLATSPEDDHSSLSTALMTLHGTHPSISTLTARTFWIQQVQSAWLRMPEQDFAAFVTENPSLAHEELWRVYYSREVWTSWEAGEVFVAPDLRGTSHTGRFGLESLVDERR